MAQNDSYGGGIVKKMTRIFGITIITAVGLAACGQTNTDHKNHESKEEKDREKGNESGGNCTERNERKCIE